MGLISLAIRIYMHLVQIQIHQTQRTLRGCFYDPIPPGAGLDHKLSPFGNKFRLYPTAIGLRKNDILIPNSAFNLAASHRQIKKKSLLCVLGVSAVRFQFWNDSI